VKFGIKVESAQVQNEVIIITQPEMKLSKPRGRPPKKLQQLALDQQAAICKSSSIRIQNQFIIKQ
jgi:hypothetical protein